ncbi:pseudaminic acid cytidylyltransferase [Vibrio chemaguriensis]
MDILFIIPARGGSKRIPKKNIRQFLGKEIISYPIKSALSSAYCSKLIVSTDSKEISEVAIRYGAEVPFLRSEKNSNDFATTYDVIEEVCSSLIDIERYEYICCIYPTSVFVTTKMIDEAIRLAKAEGKSGAVSVLEYSHPIQRALCVDESGNLRSTNPEFYNSRSQDLEKHYHDAGQFYLFNLNSARMEKKLILKESIPIILTSAQAQDIDTEEDWNLAEIKYRLTHNV